MSKGDLIILEFLEVFINAILYAREIYPSAIFKKRKIYNTYAYISLFPSLNDYILNILKSAKELQSSNQLKCVEIILSKDNVNLESYIFEVHPKNIDTDDKYLQNVEMDLRKVLLRLNERLKDLKKLPNNTNFKIVLHTSESAFIELSNISSLQNFPWIHDETLAIKDDKMTIIPITDVTSAGIHIYVNYLK